MRRATTRSNSKKGETSLSQAQRRKLSQAKIISSARQLFGQQGFANTSLEQVASNAGMTIGPIYHYYGNKAEVFRVVTEACETELAEALLAAAQQDAELLNLWRVFTDFCRDSGFVQIVLKDAPHVLGRQRWPETQVVKVASEILQNYQLAQGAQAFSELDRLLLQRSLMAALAEVALMLVEYPDYDSQVFLQKLLGLLKH